MATFSADLSRHETGDLFLRRDSAEAMVETTRWTEESLARVGDAPGAVGDEASRLARQLDLLSGRAYRINRRIEARSASPKSLG